MTQPEQNRISRRGFLAGAAALAGALPAVRLATAVAADARLPAPGRSGLDHIVVVMMENRSFDHLLGWRKGADGRQAGVTYFDWDGNPRETFPLAPDFAGCAYHDPDHSYEGGRIQYHYGACDGWLRAGTRDLFPIGYYRRRDLPFLGEAAVRFTVCDRYFSAFMGPTQPNRLYLHAGASDREVNGGASDVSPTIWDRLAERGLRGRYYFGNFSTLSWCWPGKYDSINLPYSRFLTDCRSGRLPHVAYVDPAFGINDDHPRLDIRAGESFLYEVYRAVVTSPAWRSTLLIITYDEWGGFFDHVPPPVAPDADPRYVLRGFRVPCLLISPFARRGHVAHGLYDHASVLKLIEWRWKLAPLSVRDRYARNLALALDFSKRNLAAPRFNVPVRLSGAVCPDRSAA
jgi:phospholipase C